MMRSANILRCALLGALFIAIAGIASTVKASPDQGTNLTHLPPPPNHASGPCDRACLLHFVDQYFEALQSHCACGIAMAPDVKYTENGQAVKPGEGIWKTFTGRGHYRVYLADEASGEAGYYGDINEFRGTLLGVMALRLKIQNRQITEIEEVVARQELRPEHGLGANTAGVMTPRLIDEVDPKGFASADSALLKSLAAAQRSTREQLVAATNAYYEGFNEHSAASVPFADHCVRRENGIDATNNSNGPALDPAQPSFHVFGEGCAEEMNRGFFSALQKVREHRPLVVDAQQGLVLDLALFDNEGNVKSVSVSGVGAVAVPVEYLRPITFVKPQLFKIESGKIREIEGLSWPVPYGMRSGWEE